MRHGRAKSSRRTLQFYRLNAPHIVKSPYKILLDGTFLAASIRNKVPLHDRFSKTLQHAEFTFYVTRSTLVELGNLAEEAEKVNKSGVRGKRNHATNLGEDVEAILRMARQFGLDECEIIESDDIPHDASTEGNGESSKKKKNKAFKDFSDASIDIFRLSTVGGKNNFSYFVATQDDALSDALRSMPYVPLFRLGRAVLLLESPSAASRRFTSGVEQDKLASAGGLMTLEERRIVDVLKKKEKVKLQEKVKEEEKKAKKRDAEQFGVSFGGAFTQRKESKRAKGPNPLSCKKRKV
mmetsp:Transcript_31167/g.59407  ORF Transcript_31167/g.59407 Transcript_31167/m.59407 type:complete len:295 (+) Transcript_31167:48-932(+)